MGGCRGCRRRRCYEPRLRRRGHTDVRMLGVDVSREGRAMKKLSTSIRLRIACAASIMAGGGLTFAGGCALAFGVILLVLGVVFFVCHLGYSVCPKCSKLMVGGFTAKYCQHCGEQVFE